MLTLDEIIENNPQWDILTCRKYWTGYRVGYEATGADLDCLGTVKVKSPCQEHEKEHNMGYAYAQATMSATTKPPELTQAEFLKDRLETLKDNKKAALRAKFFINEPKSPSTLGELRARLAAGQFTIADHGYTDDYRVYGADSWISWRTKDTQADQAGYDAAKAVLKAAAQKVADEIMSLDYNRGLTAVQQFEATA